MHTPFAGFLKFSNHPLLEMVVLALPPSNSSQLPLNIARMYPNLKIVFVSGQQPGNSFFKRACRYSNNFFSCLNSYSLTLSMISTPLVFFLSFFYLYLNQATCIIFFSLLQICNSNNVQINPPGHLSGHLSRISVTFGMLQGIAYTSQKLPLSGALQTLKTNSKLIKDQLSGLRQFTL